jgi:hypothetical protein
MECSGAELHTIELSLRDRNHEISHEDRFTPGNTNYLQLSTTDEMWHKENLLNIAISRLPADWQYVAWVDADVIFARPDWVQETIQQLQHYHVVQMFSHALDLGPNHEPLSEFSKGFMYSYQNGDKLPLVKSKSDGYYTPGAHYWHPGYAWAARRSAITATGGLGDIGILGSGDFHMAAALIGKVEYTIRRDYNPTYLDYWKEWEENAIKGINLNVGHVPGSLFHYFHGKKANRRYNDRNTILVENDFNYLKDVIKDNQGLWKFKGNKPALRDQIRKYFSQRNEDSIDV